MKAPATSPSQQRYDSAPRLVRTAYRTGFTLIELLVSIGIIALLMGILLPVLSTVQRRSRSTACKAQLHQIGAAFQMYLNQNQFCYPLSPALPSVNPFGYPTVNQALARDVDDVQRIFHCPADHTLFQTEGVSYYYYIEVGQRHLEDTFFYKVFKSASLVPILWDADRFHGSVADDNWLFADSHVEDGFVTPAGS